VTQPVGSACKVARLLALLGAVAFSPVVCSAQQAGPSTWLLVYAGGPKRLNYSVNDFVHLIAHVDTAGRPAGWLCTGTIFLEIFAPSGKVFATWIGGQPAGGNDWSAYLDTLFDTGGVLRRLDSTVALVSVRAGAPRERFSVAIMIPYPDSSVSRLDAPWGSYELAGIDGRLKAVDSYINEVLHRFRTGSYAHLNLVGFYWLRESIADADVLLTNDVAKRIHKLGLRFLWIPYYNAPGTVLWNFIGFDQAWLQPNYFFHPHVPALRMDSAVARARSLELGLEIEFDVRLFTGGEEFSGRLDPYLHALGQAPDLRRKSVVIFDGAGALLQLSSSKDSVYRALYSRLATTLMVEP